MTKRHPEMMLMMQQLAQHSLPEPLASRGLLSRPVTPQKEVKLRRSAQKTQQLRSENASRNDLERQKYKGLLKHLTNSGFVEDLAVMKDILRELQSLSLKLQRREMTLVDSSVHIK
ncbi:hypothetical protein NQZ68_023716 [Dissostichus eleginoides]|nr:hypothetical protein NQZ68_023716 [Dissostichus eleginoides]